MHLLDHLFLILIAVIQPVLGGYSNRKYIRLIKTGTPPMRKLAFQQTSLMLWTACAILAVIWLGSNRPFSELGFSAGAGWRFWLGLGLTALVSAYLLYAWRQVRNLSAEERAGTRDSLGDLAFYLPITAQERRWYNFTSITAGFVEEVIYRGFLLWYLLAFMPLWGAVLLSSLIFGIAHSYQGVANMVKITGIGLAMAGLYVLTETIWVPVIAHMLLDLLQGLSIREIFRDAAEHSPGQSSEPDQHRQDPD